MTPLEKGGRKKKSHEKKNKKSPEQKAADAAEDKRWRDKSKNTGAGAAHTARDVKRPYETP